MSDTDRLAALLLHPVMDGYRDAHLAYSQRGGPNVDQPPYWVQVAESIAARLIAAGVTLAATPAPLASLPHGQGSGNDTVILRNSLTIHATPAPLDAEREALRRQHLEETHRASGSCPGWTCPTARVLTALAPGDES